MRSLILILLYTFLVIFLGVPAIIFSYITGAKDLLFRLGKFGLRLSKPILGMKLIVLGKENINFKTPYVFMANHQSFIDGPLGFYLIDIPVRVFPKKEVFKIPIIGLGMKLAGFIPVDRKNRVKARSAIEKAVEIIKKEKCSFLIFPEGTRSIDGNLLPFKKGGFVLAIKSNVPIVPISIVGSKDIIPKGKFSVRKGTVRVKFHSPISTDGYTIEDRNKLVEVVRNEIKKGLEEK
ncbi:MAG: lysophospholipid acyltransferase family protein [Acidobacteriota bacterium]